jgi:hypothetical protein
MLLHCTSNGSFLASNLCLFLGRYQTGPLQTCAGLLHATNQAVSTGSWYASAQTGRRAMPKLKAESSNDSSLKSFNFIF